MINILSPCRYTRSPTAFLVPLLPAVVFQSFLAVTVVAASSSAGGADAQPFPNVVMILVDDMGFGDPQCYNSNSKISTPYIDSLAEQGMRFTDAHASGPLCHLSRYGLMTGRYPFRANCGRWPKEPVIPADQPTLGGMLQSAGYATAMVGKWHLGFAENGYQNPLPGGPIDRGFDSFFGIRASTDIPPYFYIRGDKAVAPPTLRVEARNTPGWTPIQGEFWRAGGIAPDLQLKDVLPRFTDEAIDVVKQHATETPSDQKRPLFLYLAYPAPHTPWLPAKEFIGKSGASMYGDFTMMVDSEIGRLLNTLQQHQLDENTLFIFSSDNGPVWYPHDIERFDHDAVGGLRGMKSDAWEGGHRMPFIVRWPGHVRPGSTSGQLVSFVDIFATLADLTKTTLSDDAAIDSFSFLSVLTGESKQSARTELALHSGRKHRTLRLGNLKFIDRPGSGGFSKPDRNEPSNAQLKHQLYDLQIDRGEQQNLAGERTELVRKMQKRLKEIETSNGHRHLAMSRQRSLNQRSPDN